MKIVSAEYAVGLIQDGWRVITGGFGCCGNPDTLTDALRNRFERTEHPRGLRLFFAAGGGNKAGKGIDRLALPDLVVEAVGGFWGFCPKLTSMAQKGLIEGHNWPQGVISKLFSAIGAGDARMASRIGLGTFIDPRIEGGLMNTRFSSLVTVSGEGSEEYLSYPALHSDCCLLRGTASDYRGNISMARETSWMDAVAQAIAVSNRGGIVIVQVEEIVDQHATLAEIKIPGMLVNYVVLSTCKHPATYGKPKDARFSQTGRAGHTVQKQKGDEVQDTAKKIIVRRAFEELKTYRGCHVNFGIGIPALLGAYAKSQGFDDFWMTIESGTVGGIPEEGLAFGAAVYPEAIMEQSVLFDFYHGGGIEAAFLGFGEIDVAGNVNVSRFGNKLPGAGGFINITQSARNIVFCGTFSTTGLLVKETERGVKILQEGAVLKFVPLVEQITFSAQKAREMGQNILYITERAVFRLGDEGIELMECQPNINPDDIWSALPSRNDIKLTY